ncbi:MAG: hypothetical protein M3Q58_04260 [Bacteroidota bacterium]|nr:hypothetical protein [Bacteroidota bacterium]
MKYKEYLNELRNDVIQKLTAFHKAENELSLEGNGFIDKSYIDKREKTYKQWQEAHNNFTSILSFIVKNQIALDQEVDLKKLNNI